ncbi:DUF2092 domain-containing protein [Fundidesulfovibrio magnetotacticus]|nr:DUF2092 domain-containing protein [Fundidesulfovibrio magnetotacticus]
MENLARLRRAFKENKLMHFRAKAVSGVLAVLALSLCVCLPVQAKEKKKPQAPDVDARAVSLLEKSCHALAALNEYSFEADVTLDKVYGDGSKVQAGRRMEVRVRRPGAFRIVTDGDDIQVLSVFDGKAFSLLLPDRKAYAQLPAAMDTDALMDMLSASYGIESTLGDLISNKPCDRLKPESSYYVGKAKVAGTVCDQLFFLGKDVDWQIWLEDSATPYPRKIVITEKRQAGAPQFSAVLSNWKGGPQPAGSFEFEPPAGAVRDDAIITGKQPGKQ